MHEELPPVAEDGEEDRYRVCIHACAECDKKRRFAWKMSDPWGNSMSTADLKAQVRLEKPVCMRGDSKEAWLPTDMYHQKESKSDKHTTTPFSYPERLPFYDREALEGKMRELRAAKLHLFSVEEGLRERLTKAENVLMAMQSSKRELSSVASVLDGAAITKQGAARGGRKAASLMMGERRHHRGGGDRARGNCIPASCRQKCTANFSARNRIMELTELNHQLRRAQGKVESVAKSHQEAADATRAELEKVQGRLRAMPKRFTESRQSLGREVRILEDQKRSLQLAQREKAMEDQDPLVMVKQEQRDLDKELDFVLDEIDEVEDDRDRWRRQVPVEVARAKSLLSQRADALSALRARFGENAVEHAAFVMALQRCDLPPGGSNNEKMEKEVTTRSSTLPLSAVADALKPAYEPQDGVDLTTEAVLSAAHKCGIHVEKDGETTCSVSFPEFCLVSAKLRSATTRNIGDEW